jgi:hypothetical protein
VDKLDKFMRGDAYGKGDHIHGRRPQDGVLTPSYTPGSASILQPGATILNRNCNNGNGVQPVPPSYQRQGSNESGKGSYSSDKEMGGIGSNGFCNGVGGGGGGGAISVANPVALHRYLSCASRLLFLWSLSVFILVLSYFIIPRFIFIFQISNVSLYLSHVSVRRFLWVYSFFSSIRNFFWVCFIYFCCGILVELTIQTYFYFFALWRFFCLFIHRKIKLARLSRINYPTKYDLSSLFQRFN